MCRCESERELASVRYRTVGDMTITGAVRSDAADISTVVAEIAAGFRAGE